MRRLMRGRTLLGAALAVTMLFSVQPGAPAKDRFPKHRDVRSWELPEHMTWSDYKPIPDGNYAEADNPIKIRIALILGDFKDQKFRVAETSTDPTGQRGLGVQDPKKFWLDYLFNKENPNFYNKGHTVTEYWLEDSYGLVQVEAEAFGPYRMDGKMYEYGTSDHGTSADCPDGPDGCSRDFDTELLQKSTADVAAATDERGPFQFRFLLHSGYDESGVWLNYGQALFPNKNAVTDRFGPDDPDHRNWGTTRYVPWTSFFATQQIWSHALPGLLSTQGESDGGSTYAHELSHIFGILDNYNNPYAENPDRAYSGPWDMMSRGTFNGPGGPFERWTIPPREGGTMGAHHMLRNKIRLGFIPPSEVLHLNKAALDAAGVVRTRILQRESPPALTEPTLNSGLRIVLGRDRSSCDDNDPLCDGGGYDFYDVEVVNRQGFDSFLPDHGVIIAKTKAADAAPFIWVIDAFPKDIGGIDYVTANGKKVPYTVGDYRQLADAAFHASNAPGTRNRYKDKANGLAFFVLKKKTIEKRLVYTVAVASLDPTVPPEQATVEKVEGGLEIGAVSPIVYEVTNPGLRDAVYKLRAKTEGAQTRFLQDIVYIPSGSTKRVTVWTRATRPGGSVELIASPIG
jgi:M6 family metalloprotease-like protein